mmetsp:Transcript_1557/g.6196  ORF Transcript_1557/g.6196 Transcript_1557/m.6196 type:complete len:217 (+) Transcript_1557:412-1062(+)
MCPVQLRSHSRTSWGVPFHSAKMLSTAAASPSRAAGAGTAAASLFLPAATAAASRSALAAWNASEATRRMLSPVPRKMLLAKVDGSSLGGMGTPQKAGGMAPNSRAASFMARRWPCRGGGRAMPAASASLRRRSRLRARSWACRWYSTMRSVQSMPSPTATVTLWPVWGIHDSTSFVGLCGSTWAMPWWNTGTTMGTRRALATILPMPRLKGPTPE